MKKSTHWIICGLFLLVPPFLNFIIYRPNFLNFQIVGTAVDWLGFYGSYLGSALGSLTTLYVLYSTIRNSRHEQATELIHKEISKIQDDIADRFGKYTIDDLFLILQDTKDNICKGLSSQYEKYYSLRCSAIVLYGPVGRDGYQNNEEKQFFEEYISLLDETQTLIQEMTMLERTGHLQNNKCDEKISYLKERNKEVFRYAGNYLQSLKREYTPPQN